MKWRLSALACAAALASLYGCGGSSGNSAPSSLKVSGVAAQGAPLVGVTVTATDSTGATTQSSVTDANGNFTATLSGKAPYVLTAPITDADGTPAVLSSVLDASNSGSAVANLNPLTSLITQRALGTTLTAAPTGTQIASAKLSSSSIAQETTVVLNVLQPLFAAAGVTVTNPLGGSYVANSSNPLDNLFDTLPIVVHTGTVHLPSITAGSNVALNLAPSQSDSQVAAEQSQVQTAANGNPQFATGATTTPIQHVVVIIGENQTFDGLFGTYQAPSGQSVKNLLSEGIVNADGTPGPNFALAQQNQAAGGSTYSINPARTGSYATLLPPQNTGILTVAGLQTYLSEVASQQAPTVSPTSYLFGLADADFPQSLPAGPFQITANASNGSLVSYSAPSGTAVGAAAGSAAYTAAAPIYAALGLVATTGDPVHRFFQMWQQTGGDNSKLDLYTWVAATAGQGGSTVENAPGSNQVTAATPGQGGELMGFMNMAAGDAPFWASLAKQGALSDNYHQAVMGGTGMNFFSIATGDLPWFNSNGAVATPPSNQIENPNPVQGSANPNFYTQDGYEGGSYVNCSDSAQPGVAAILGFLASKHVASNCDAGKYYLVNNYNPGYTTAGTTQPIGANDYNYPPQTVPTIAEALNAKGVSWGWYTSARDTADTTGQASKLVSALGLPSSLSSSIAGLLQSAEYNNIGDPLVASRNVMTSPAMSANLQDQTAFITAAASGKLPAVSFVVPPNTYSGHPGFSSPAAFEGWLQQVLAAVQSNKAQWANTAVIITTDEGGGHFDTGPIQNVDFFGDGPRIPLIVLSPWAKTNVIDHTYNDHASILKFIERNWRLAPLSPRSRDRLPNPAMQASSYLPANQTPTIGDLMTMFNF
ncbi:alkaline phosphatase family protein [Paraburkholderia lycopersici]|uniref:Phospholipase C n=1 Tax=Paraburkholderia lycopersici TaxID=416944 RepID=A0A1G6YRW2_9BURK|nr:alkaline phosphatase family protein [Paraburkholderia lycopersici]SDD92763.1 phospholipase C [Paraburkholderia lycopersici]